LPEVIIEHVFLNGRATPLDYITMSGSAAANWASIVEVLKSHGVSVSD
jgi:hypothetical protein